MNARPLALLATPIIVAPVLAGLMALPAHAGIPVFGTGDVWVQSRTTTSATLCGKGAVDDPTYVAGVWTFSAVGFRAAGLPIAQVSPPYIGASLPQTCLTVNMSGAVVMGFAATVTLAAVGTSDVTVVCELTLEGGLTSTPNEVAGTCTDNAPGVPGT
jgi:hypothetical protein